MPRPFKTEQLADITELGCDEPMVHLDAVLLGILALGNGQIITWPFSQGVNQQVPIQSFCFLACHYLTDRTRSLEKDLERDRLRFKIVKSGLTVPYPA